MRTLITGATGFVGRRLVQWTSEPVVLSRRPDEARRALGAGVRAFAWNPESGPPPAEAFEGVEAVVHLAGESVAEGRWTAAKKRRIRESRVLGTRNLVAALQSLGQKPAVLVSASAVGYYGSRGEEELLEDSPPSQDFLGEVCQAWEAEALRARAAGIRVVTPRIGLVLGPGGGALSRMLPIFKLAAGGRLGSGRQWMPWVHLDDLVGLILWARDSTQAEGAMNAVAPHPVRNSEFTQTLARAVRRPAIFPAPAFGLRLALGEFAEVLLASQRVFPRAAEQGGYRFQFPRLADALRASLAGPAPVSVRSGS